MFGYLLRTPKKQTGKR